MAGTRPPIQAIIFDFYGVIRPNTVSPADLAKRDGLGKDRELLSFIASLRPRYRTGLLSNSDTGLLAYYFRQGEAGEYFDATAISGETGHAKPAPEAFTAIAAQLGVPPVQCLMVDDIGEYCEAARATGMQAIRYTSLISLKTSLASLNVTA
ncbi:HAD-IA family hydrolase [Candidatus Saccharibacteria bacterium]|nr:HAD-IA family hydrolase [Candidatus Saccharibacteria bacterium]